MIDNQKTLEQRLQELDLSDQSQVRHTVGLELRERLGEDLSVENTQNRRWNMFRNPMPAFVLGFFIAMAGFSVAHPDTREALMKIPSFFRVGESTIIISGGQKDDTADEYFRKRGEEATDAGTMFTMATIYGGYGCGVPEGADPFMKQTPSLVIAADLVNRPLMVPTYFNEAIPQNYQFRKAQILPNGLAAFHFGIGPYETMLTQQVVDVNNMVSYGTSTVETKDDGSRITTYLTPQLEELTIAGKTVFWQVHDAGMRRRLGRWAEKETDTVIGKFYWEDGGQSFVLDGRLLTREEGLKIIKSLKPYKVD